MRLAAPLRAEEVIGSTPTLPLGLGDRRVVGMCRAVVTLTDTQAYMMPPTCASKCPSER